MLNNGLPKYYEYCACFDEVRGVRSVITICKAKLPFFIDIFTLSVHMVFYPHPRYTRSSSVHSQRDARHKPGWDNALCCCKLCSTTNLADLSVWYVLFTFENAYSRISHGFWDSPVLGKKNYWKLYLYWLHTWCEKYVPANLTLYFNVSFLFLISINWLIHYWFCHTICDGHSCVCQIWGTFVSDILYYSTSPLIINSIPLKYFAKNVELVFYAI